MTISMIPTIMIRSSGTMAGATAGHGDRGAVGTVRSGAGIILTTGPTGAGDQDGIIRLTVIIMALWDGLLTVISTELFPTVSTAVAESEQGRWPMVAVRSMLRVVAVPSPIAQDVHLYRVL